ncbi:MAG: gas vesicle protein GvpD P-loop domain-containing protein [Candidatus Hydrothermarchaeota archaeon]
MIPQPIPNEILEAFRRYKGYPLLVKGAPGTGKTIFSLELLNELSKEGDSIYLSTRTSIKDLYNQFPWLEGVLFEENILDASKSYTLRTKDPTKAIYYGSKPEFLQAVYEKVDELKKPATLVIDSWDAVVHTAKEGDEEEIINTLIDLAKENGTNIVLIVEERKHTSLEYLVDGVITLTEERINDLCVRKIHLNKLRGIKRRQPFYLFTLSNGRFQYFEPFKVKRPKEPKIFEPIPDKERYFSTGSEDLDELLEGGYRKGSFVLIEVEEGSLLGLSYLVGATIKNFVTQKRGDVGFTVAGSDAEVLKRIMVPYVGEENFDSYVRILEKDPRVSKPYVVPIKGESLKEDFNKLSEVVSEIGEKRGEPVLIILGFDNIEYMYGPENMVEPIAHLIAYERKRFNLCIGLLKPGLSVAQQVANMANVHLKITQIGGAFCLYGIRPTSGLYNLDVDVSMGYPKIKLIPIV